MMPDDGGDDADVILKDIPVVVSVSVCII